MRKDKSVRWQELKAGAYGIAAGGAAYLLDTVGEEGSVVESGLDYVVPVGYVGGGLAVAAAVAHNRWYFSARQRLLRALGEDGWIEPHHLKTYAGAAALYRQADYLRPDLPFRPGGLRLRQSPTQYGFDLGAIVAGERAVRGKHLYSPYGRSIKLIGPPGSGKSQLLINLILDHPGAQVVTSTKLELWEKTAQLRGLTGRTWLFNPSGLGGVPGTFSWDPVGGCTDQAIADRRAWALVRGGGGAAGIDRSDFWAGKAQEILRCYLMAAALANFDMAAVHYWAANPDDRTPVGILQANPAHVPAGWIGTLESSLNASPNTRTGYFATVISCVGFMDNPAVAAACRPRKADDFDIAAFVHGNGTLYAVGSESDRRLAPLLTALTEHIYDGIKAEAAKCSGGRLPRGAAFMLDEVAQQTPVPLGHWAPDSRGANITLVVVLQAEAQLRMTWGADAASVIAQSLPTKVYLGGISDEAERRAAAELAGKREVARVSEGKSSSSSGSTSTSTNTSSDKEPVLDPHVLFGLPADHAFVHGLGGDRGAVVRYEPGRVRVKRELRKLSKARTARPVIEMAPVGDGADVAGARA
jgi:type IV secretion system protein VirD4